MIVAVLAAALAAGQARAQTVFSAPGDTSAFAAPDGPVGFSQAPPCPRGFTRLATPGSLQRFRCVPEGSGTAAPAAPGARLRAGGLSFTPPPGFRVQDDWKDSVPTLYMELADSGTGKPVSITITHLEPKQSDFADLNSAVRRDERWQGAREIKPLRVADVHARATEVPERALSVYLPDGRQSYYAFVFAGPQSLYAHRRSEFLRLLKSVRREARRP
ncbi:MAG: hypothetical protein HKL90_07050 [Elusimicrobia bacterium]|nr:hypothetical protein [Elusimicrobiota bacterium]